MKYRSEIDGLRSVAVLPVIFFHAGLEVFSGGFVGVDVFFVISGYLITTVLVSDLKQGDFSLVHFYERRARRILPALFLVIFACLPAAWLLLSPEDLASFSRSIVSVATFSSNFLFWSESGYFNTAAELKPLLHTWSLAVEEQYYILFPLLLLAGWKLGIRALCILLVLVGVLSLMLAQWGAFAKPSATFYLLPTRGWELLMGAGAALMLDTLKVRNWCGGKHAEPLSVLGLALVLLSIFIYSEETPFPSLYTLVPTLGTLLIILFAVEGTLVQKALGLKPLVFVGLLSYSAYLWHQPLLAFAKHAGLYTPTLPTIFALLVLVIGFSYLSWRFVEKPFRDKQAFNRKQIFRYALIGSFVLLFVGAIGHFFKGFPGRFDVPDYVSNGEFELARIDNGWCFYSIDTIGDLEEGSDGLQCHLGSNAPVMRGMLFGDSFAGQYEPFWDSVGKALNYDIHAVTTNWCYPGGGEGFSGSISSPAYAQCLFNRRFLSDHAQAYDFIVLAGDWYEVERKNNLDEVTAVISKLNSAGLPVIVMAAPVHFEKFSINNSVYGAGIPIPSKKEHGVREANRHLREYAESRSEVLFIQRQQLYGAGHGVNSWLTSEGEPYSWDGNHISIYGSRKAAENFLGMQGGQLLENFVAPEK
jgi:peptidoglycan/LPS O-acetylase OafA/YrhL